MCLLEIEKGFTTIINMLTDKEDNPANKCVIETEELRDLILAWLPLRRLDPRQRDTEAIRRVSAPMTDQSLVGHEAPADASLHA
jgi:hypothetical protein